MPRTSSPLRRPLLAALLAACAATLALAAPRPAAAQCAS